MQPRHRVSRAAIEHLKRFEGYRRRAARLADGRWTLGHGHTQTAREGAEVTFDDAEALLLYDLISVAHTVNEYTYAPLTQNQFDALCCFAFSIGLDAFRQSAVLARVNEGQPLRAGLSMALWRKADVAGERIVVDSLVRRRAAETALFLTPPDGAFVPAPSSILRPLLDIDATGLIPAKAPLQVTAAMDGEAAVAVRQGKPPEPEPVPDPEQGDAMGAAADAVTQRLESLMAEPAPIAWVPPAPPSSQQPFVLTHPEPEPWRETEPGAPPRPSEEEGPRGPDLFEAAPPRAEPSPARGPFEFLPARPAAKPAPDQGGLLTDLGLGVLGLAFFSGGVFWAANARPGTGNALFNPTMVGLLAGIAGIGFFAVAVYRLLERLGQASERDRDG